MCGRYTITSPAQVIAEAFGVDEPIELAPRYNVCPGQDVPVVRFRRGEEKRSLDMLRWGLVPWFAKEPGPAARMINARAETAATSPAFREALRERRCLVPADGFYEWQATADKRGRKQPFWLHRADARPLAFAGLWERWTAKDGRRIESCTILTTEPNELVRPIHDRMPVILPSDAYALWLDRDVQDIERVRELLAPARAGELVATPV
ncbi:MAG: SOS response-associated peptidase, partial [Thermodesulfobacteriota bacterium]